MGRVGGDDPKDRHFNIITRFKNFTRAMCRARSLSDHILRRLIDGARLKQIQDNEGAFDR